MNEADGGTWKLEPARARGHHHRRHVVARRPVDNLDVKFLHTHIPGGFCANQAGRRAG